MPVESAADRALFFDTDEFGTTAVHKLQVPLTTQDVDGIFDDGTVNVGSVADIDVAAPGPVFTCATETLPTGWAVNDELNIDGVDYIWVDHDEDGTGLITIILERKS